MLVLPTKVLHHSQFLPSSEGYDLTATEHLNDAACQGLLRAARLSDVRLRVSPHSQPGRLIARLFAFCLEVNSASPDEWRLRKVG